MTIRMMIASRTTATTAPAMMGVGSLSVLLLPGVFGVATVPGEFLIVFDGFTNTPCELLVGVATGFGTLTAPGELVIEFDAPLGEILTVLAGDFPGGLLILLVDVTAELEMTLLVGFATAVGKLTAVGELMMVLAGASTVPKNLPKVLVGLTAPGLVLELLVVVVVVDGSTAPVVHRVVPSWQTHSPAVLQ